MTSTRNDSGLIQSYHAGFPYMWKNVCSTGRRLEPLSALQPDFKFDWKYGSISRGTLIFSNALLLHKLLITGKGKQVVSRKAELDRDLLNKTCEYKSFSRMGTTFSKVSCRRNIAPGVQNAHKILEMMDFFSVSEVWLYQFCSFV